MGAEVRTQVRAFVTDLLTGKGDSQPLSDDDDLFLSGRLQSIDAVNIVLFVEEHFAIDFAKARLEMQQLGSVDAICAAIKATRATAD